jgi:PST family polysaccharide transporter/lipopolysaccharide exporter
MRGNLLSKLRRLFESLIPGGDDLINRTVKSGIWVAVMNFSERGLGILLLVVLAGLLDPRDFGLMGIALLTLASLKQFSKLGIDDALIQAEDDDVDEELNTFWSMEAARGVVLCGIMFGAAPLIAGFFSEPRATPILRVLAFSPLAIGLRNPAVVYFQKNLEFHKQFLYRVSGSVVYFVVGVGYALLSPTVWALVIGYVAGDVVRTVVSYLADDYRPWPSFDFGIAKQRFGYGKWVTGTTILYFLYSRGDDAFIGWALSATALGFYQLAYRLSNAPATEITHTISGVTFPAYSKVQNEIGKLREGFFNTIRITTLVSFPMAIGIAAVAPTFVDAFFGADWRPMVPAMQLLAVYGLMRSLGATFGPVWKAVGRPDYVTKLSLLRVVLIALLIYPVTMRFGIEGTALLITGIYVFPMMPLDVYLVLDTVDSSLARFVREVSYPFVASLLMGVAVTLVQNQLALGSAVLEFAVLVGVGVVTYAAATLAMMTAFQWELKQNLSMLIGSIQG